MINVARVYSIQTKLTLNFLLILLPLVGVSIFANFYSQSIMNEQISDRTKGALLSTLEYVDQLTKNMDQQTLLIASNPNIVDIWKGIDNPLSPDHLYEIHTVQQQLTALTNVNGAVKEAYIIHGESGNGVSTLKGGVKWPEVKKEFWFEQTIAARGGLVVFVPTKDSSNPLAHSAYISEDMIYYIRMLDVLSNNKEPNVMVLAVDKSSFQKIIQNLQTSNNINITLFYNDGFVLETNPNSQQIHEQQPFSIKVESGVWSIRLEQPKAEVFQLSHTLQLFTYLISAISIILAFWIAWLVYNGIAKPLHQLSSAFKQFSSGNLAVEVIHHRKDEFGFVMNGFNRMAAAQRKMIEDDYEKELRLAKAEFSLLQSQINPHFLYNTLDSIYSVALTKQIPEISDMVINLARFFRVSLGKGRDSFTLEETAQHLMYYIRVQQIRSDHFTVDIDLQEETKEIPILKLILQPIVENAIIHGLEKSFNGGYLYIRSRIEEGSLYVEVEDTGVGISKEKLAGINQEMDKITNKSYLNSPDKPSSLYYGLKNVKSRITLYYGADANLTVESKEGESTKVILRLPLRKDEDR
ncbi:sensor histidine kinase [Paenibacillus agricola]|uniref:histidine kinase n=1 Tax=Paenibacillus agricola TaxID=2716264 RepID=A0ABX0IZL2_9BACL|nr:histidine kinase [Paenibacillus agricola]NHN29001.1 sensor histidine kinase [Paenibacillus agricola]